jgi:hypothetical protein
MSAADNHDYIDPASFRSIDSLPIRDTHPGMLNLDRVRLHVQRPIERRRYDGPSDLNDPTVYLIHSRCLIADGEALRVTPAACSASGITPRRSCRTPWST